MDLTKEKQVMLSIRSTVYADGLVGGDFEYKPYFAYWATWGAYRVPKRTELDILYTKKSHNTNVNIYKNNKSIGPFILPKPDDTRGDESIWLKLLSRSKHSGIPDLDKRERDGIDRNVQSGIVQLSLSKIIALIRIKRINMKITTTKTTSVTVEIDSVFIDPKLLTYYIQKGIIDAKNKALQEGDVDIIKMSPGNNNEFILTDEMREEILRKATGLSRKANVKFYITATFTKSSIMMIGKRSTPQQRQQQHHGKQLIYGNEYTREFSENTFNTLFNNYVDMFIPTDKGDPLYPALNERINHLQLVIYKSEQGVLPAYAYWSLDYFTNEYTNEKDRLKDEKIYGFNDKTEVYFETLVKSALRRYGLSEEVFIKEIKRQFSSRDDKVSSLYLTCIEAASDVGTFAANSGNYTSDMRYSSGSRSRLFGKPIFVESFDRGLLNGTTNSADCEDQENASATIIRDIARGKRLSSNHASTQGVELEIKTSHR